MQTNEISIELEPEDVELLTRVEWETGKSVNQLTLEAIRAIYKREFDSDRDAAIALLEAIHKIQQQTRDVLTAVQKQSHEIELFSSSSNSSSSNSNSLNQDAQASYPPPV